MIVTEKAKDFIDKKYAKYMAEYLLTESNIDIITRKIKLSDSLTCDFLVDKDGSKAGVFVFVMHEDDQIDDAALCIDRPTMRMLAKKSGKFIKSSSRIVPYYIRIMIVGDGKAAVEMGPMETVI